MALFHFGKKKEEEKKTCGCACGTAADGCCEGAGGSCTIKVLGSGCKNCHTLLENTKEAVKTAGICAEVAYVTDMQEIMAYGVMSILALVVNEKVVSMGKVLRASEVAQLLHKLGF